MFLLMKRSDDIHQIPYGFTSDVDRATIWSLAGGIVYESTAEQIGEMDEVEFTISKEVI